jgi:Ser/Thr protein kinase RdoA (MazF antagonist)
VATAWGALPAQVRREIEQTIGPVVKAVPTDIGNNNDIAAVLDLTEGRAFLKGVKGISRPMRWLRNEVKHGALAAPFAPKVILSVDLEDWFVAVFEYVPGRPADLSPQSPDLRLVGAVLERLSVLSAPGLKSLRERWTVRDWWGRLAVEAPERVSGLNVSTMDRYASAAPDAVLGHHLAHTDLHGDQFILGAGDQVRVIDWGWPAAAANWVDTAYMVIRLIEAGHAPDQAEDWAYSLRTWSAIDNSAVTAFAVFIAGLWAYRAAVDNVDGMNRRAAVARRWAEWRLGNRS